MIESIFHPQIGTGTIMRNLSQISISNNASKETKLAMQSFNSQNNDQSFSVGQTCVALGFLGMEDEIVIVSPVTGRVATFTYNEDDFLQF